MNADMFFAYIVTCKKVSQAVSFVAYFLFFIIVT